MRGSAENWLGGFARIGAWIALFIGFAIILGAAWSASGVEMQDPMIVDTIITTVAALGAGALLIAWLDRLSPAALGIGVSRDTPRELGVGFVIGAAGLIVATLALLVSGTLGYGPQAGTVQGWAVTMLAQAGFFALAALAEEAVFRGYAFQVLTRVAGPVAAVVVSSVLFALAHGANPSVGVFALVNIFLAGILLGIAYLRTLSLWFATALHMGWNWTMASLFDLPVSGLTTFDTPLYQPAVDGPAWWSGVLFGPEGGLVGTIGFGVALLLVLRWNAVRPTPAMIAARPLALKTEGELNVG